MALVFTSDVVFSEPLFYEQHGQVAEQILDLFDTYDIVFLGEDHVTTDQRELVGAVLWANKTRKRFDVLASEILHADRAEQFDKYDQGDLEQLFSERSGWFNSPTIKTIVRESLDPEATKICPADISIDQSSSEVRTDQAFRRYEAMPPEIQSEILQRSGFSSIAELASDHIWSRPGAQLDLRLWIR